MANLDKNISHAVGVICCPPERFGGLEAYLSQLAKTGEIRFSLRLPPTPAATVPPGMVAGTWGTIKEDAFWYLSYLWAGWQFCRESPELLGDIQILLEEVTKVPDEYVCVAVFMAMNAPALVRVTQYCKELGLKMAERRVRVLRGEKEVEKMCAISESGEKRQKLQAQIWDLENKRIKALQKGDDAEVGRLWQRIEELEEKEADLPSGIVIRS